jgi:four helix bundle suffix protein
MTTVIYDATYWFCEEFFDRRSRMIDQMVQAARSGRQNIAEGNRAAATSSQTELRLVNVARSSLDELLLDYEDFLRHRHFAQWDADSPEALAVREVAGQLARRPDTEEMSDADRWAFYAPWLEHEDSAIRANAIICLIHQANYLLDRQIEKLETQFVEEGGYSEQLAAARLAARTQAKEGTAEEIPACPQCGKAMVLRTAKQGKTAGQQFWGCSGYPECKCILPI